MQFRDLLSYIPDEELDFLSIETGVDHQVKKLKGAIVFKLLLYTMLESNQASLRVMETFFNSPKFRFLAGIPELKTKYNSISDRITQMKSGYFERIFDTVFRKFNHHFEEENDLQIYDTTMVGLSSKLVDWGMRVGRRTDKVQIKFTVGMRGSLPCTFKIFDSAEALCEDNTIPKTILDYKNSQEGIVVFDRGVQKRKTFVNFSDQEIIFVTRIKTNLNYELVEVLPFEKMANSSVEIQEDLKIHFIDRTSQKSIKSTFRLIKATVYESGEPIYFLSNNFELSPYEIANIYKKRWEIEVFFKFLKQQLNLKHLVNRSRNGITIMVYMTLITAILITAYKKENKLTGYKIVKLQISNEIYTDLIKEIVILSGGNVEKIAHFLNDS